MRRNIRSIARQKSLHRRSIGRFFFTHKPLFVFVIFLSIRGSVAFAAGPDLSDSWDSDTEQLEQTFDSATNHIERGWDTLQAQQEAAWERLRKAVESKWDNHLMPTQKKWVDYSEDLNTRSRVDFEQGTVTIETIVPADKPHSREQIETKIKQQARKLLSTRNPIGDRVLAGQIKTHAGAPVTPQIEETYLKEEIVPQIKVVPKSGRSKDGKMRKVYRTQIKLIPEHLKVRAQKYLPLVKRYASRYSVKPQLVLAVIHTESYFNPMARSHCNAIGLMQVIPRYAGREAYRYIHNKDGLIKANDLHDPERNIEFGTAYLHLLASRYFVDYPRDPKNRYLTVCGYNWGPTAMRKRIIKRYPIDKMNGDDVFLLLRQKTPKETQDYLQRVTSRMPIYDALIH